MASRRTGFEDQSTVSQVRFDPADADAAFGLEIVEGAAGDKGTHVVVEATRPLPLLVGQGPACELRLRDPEVSRRHAALEVAGDRLRVTDLGSKNGTTVDGLEIVEARLRGGERLRLGATTIAVRRVASHEGPASTASSFGRVLGVSAEMRRIFPLCERLAASHVPVILEGETGAGKELLAESLHERGPRATGPFVVFDCTTVPAGLVEAELFGSEPGSVPGAPAARQGVFELAHGGTLLLDEIGDLDVAAQAKLLRAIDRGEVRRVGGTAAMRFDVRIFAATRRDLDRDVAAGRFRDDLFHRLAVARIALPPLRRRRGDVPLLARHFWAALGGTGTPPTELLLKWEDSPWPGNVRELRNAVARYLAIGALGDAAPAADGDVDGGGATDGDAIAQILALGLPLHASRQKVIDVFERRYVAHVLAQHGGNVTRAAEAAGVARRYLTLLRARIAR